MHVASGGWWIIGDVHGCRAELGRLLDLVPDDARLALVGDFVDRGPDSIGVLEDVIRLTDGGRAVAVRGNHDERLLEALRGKPVMLGTSRARTVERWKSLDEPRRRRIFSFLAGLPHQLELRAAGQAREVVLCHAGVPRYLRGVDTAEARKLALYGSLADIRNPDTGLKGRSRAWCATWKEPDVVCAYGHVAVDEIEWNDSTVCVDTGCVYGGKLTALNVWTGEHVEVARLT